MSRIEEAGGATGSGKLPEVEGLRALAVLAVLLYHASFGFSGGYVGVDVFFVVSGFLITSLIVREYGETGRVSLVRFYARRARRLLPAAGFVLAAVVILCRILLTTSRTHRTAVDAMYAGGFLANFRFAAQGATYLNAADAPSLLQHWWSLAVEEQFYVVWPGLLAVAWWAARRVRAVSGAAHTRIVAAVTAGVVGVATFVIGLALTGSSPSWGYFATWSRAWELAVGGLCALAWGYREQVPWRGAVGWLGLGLVAFSALEFDQHTTFPGVAALAPVFGTALVIFSLGGVGGPGRVLSVWPLQWIGARSYGIYLWHWPLLMILADRVAVPDVWWRLLVLALAFGAAAAGYRLVEEPVRHLPSLVKSSMRSLAIGGAITAAVILGGVVVATTTTHTATRTGYVAAPLDLHPVPTTVISGSATSGEVTTSTAAGPTTTPDPAAELSRLVETELKPMVARSLSTNLVPDNLVPTIDKVRNDEPSIYGDGCMQMWRGITSPPCEFGDRSSPIEITLFGDSHAAQWFPALEQAAIEHHWKLVALTKAGCPPLDISVKMSETSAYPVCDQWRANTIKRIAASSTRLVVMSTFKYVGATAAISTRGWRMAMERTIQKFVAAGKQVLLLADSPTPSRMPGDCVAAHARSLSACALDRSAHTRSVEVRAGADLARQYSIHAYDPADWMCTDRCPMVIGNVMVYRDPNHLSATFSATLAPYMGLLVESIVGPSG